MSRGGEVRDDGGGLSPCPRGHARRAISFFLKRSHWLNSMHPCAPGSLPHPCRHLDEVAELELPAWLPLSDAQVSWLRDRGVRRRRERQQLRLQR
jgi:hypothetical protein